jgi:P-type Cu+ transporter
MDKEKKAAPGVTAHMIAFDDQHRELVFPVDSGDLRAGDLLLLGEGHTVPADCKLLWGEIRVREEGALFTRSAPGILKEGGLVESGTAKAYVIAADLNPPHADTP